MAPASRYANLRDYLRVIRAHRLLIVLTTVVFAAGAYAISKEQSASYQAEAAVSIADPAQDLDLAGLSGGVTAQLPQEQPSVNAATVGQPQVIDPATSALRRQYPFLSAAEVRGSVGARVEAQTNLVVIQAGASSPALAAAIANEVAQQDAATVNANEHLHILQAANSLRARLRVIERGSNELLRAEYTDQISRLRSLANFAQPGQVIRAAAVPLSPSSPKPTRNAILAALVGLTLAIVAAFGRNSLDRRLRGVGQIETELGLPLVGRVRDEAMGRAGPLRNGRRPTSEADLESFRILRANLSYLGDGRPLRTMLVTSPLAEAGKSTVAVGLAFAHAWSGRRTLLVECDLRRPVFAKRTGWRPEPGLADVLADRATLEEAIQPVPLQEAGANGNGPHSTGVVGGSLSVITAGSPLGQPGELLGSGRLESLLEQVTSTHDAVIIDSPPLLSVADTLEIVPHVDGVLLCLRATRTKREEARSAKAALNHLPERPTGLVITGLRSGDESDYGYYVAPR